MAVLGEIHCRSILNKTGISGAVYGMNPYVGCQHGCVYCYARFMQMYTHHKEEWGEFVDVKVNAPSVASLQLPRSKRGLTLLSTVTDPYQPIERKCEISRRLLEKLLEHRFPVSVLTKSSLVTRDIDLLKRLECEVGVTVTSLDDEIRKAFEPQASSVEERFSALEQLRDEGLKTYIFFGPVLPLVCDDTLEQLWKRFSEVGPERILVDRLNIKCGNWLPILSVLEKKYPEKVECWKKILFQGGSYYEGLRGRVLELSRKHGVRAEFCW